MHASEIAFLCHELNRAYCQLLGDVSQVPWSEAPEWQKDSAIAGVRQILGDPSTTPEQSHQSWMAQKVADGWVYGPVKDPEQKQHPCMVPYADLPFEQRVKDSIYGAVVRMVLEV